MNVVLYKQVVDSMLQRHYGVTVNDTGMGEDGYVEALIRGDVRPHAAVSSHAQDCDLIRTDIRGPYGVPAMAPVTTGDELNAIAVVVALHILGEELTKCPRCGARTEFDVMEDARQHHRCLDRACSHEFIAVEDDGDDEAPVSDHEPSGEVASHCAQVCGGGECGTGRVCDLGVDPETQAPLDDRFADSVVDGNEDLFDAIEIQGVRETSSGSAENCCEVDNDNPEFFSVYVHYKPDGDRGGVDCVGDFGTYGLAAHYAQELSQKYGWQIHDFVHERFKEQHVA